TRARLIDTDCSVDRGLWQINSFWHGEVTDACAFDPPCNARGTHTIWANGGWSQWTTFTNGAYQAHMAEAQAAVDQVRGGGGGGKQPGAVRAVGRRWAPAAGQDPPRPVLDRREARGGREHRGVPHDVRPDGRVRLGGEGHQVGGERAGQVGGFAVPAAHGGF